VAGFGASGRRRATVALVLALTIGVAGCSSVHPGAAAVVGQDTIDASAVDSIAAAYCSVSVAAAQAQGDPGTAQPTRDIRRGVLDALVQSDLVRAAARRLGGVHVTDAQVSQVIESSVSLPKAAPAQDTSTLRRFLEQVTRTQLTLQAIGTRLLAGSSGEQPPSAEQAVARGERYVQRYASRLDVSVDPRYGAYSPRGIGVGSGSLSVSVSKQANQALRPNLGTGSTLPAAQTCA
jgi:SurA-like N-terminal domain